MAKKLLGGVRPMAALLTSFAMLAQLISFAPPAVAAQPVPREMVEQRTAKTRVFDNGDGTYKFESFAEPIHYQDDATGPWKAINSDLVPQSDTGKSGWKNRANSFKASLPDVLGAEWVSLEASGAVVSYRPASSAVPLVEAEVSASETGTVDSAEPERIKYKSAFGPGVDVEYTSTASGLKETIVLDKYRGTSVFAFDLDTGALEPRTTVDGGIGLYSAESTTPVWVIAPPFVEDSKRNLAGDFARTEKVTYSLVPNDGIWRLSVVVDEGWLKAKARVWPVKIDPTFYFIPNGYNNYGTYQNNGYWPTMDTFVTDAYPNNNHGGWGELRVGYYPGAGNNRSYVMPDVAHLMWLRQATSINILSATMNMYCTWRFSPYPSWIYYGPAAGGWGEYGTTWANQPGYSSTDGVLGIYANTRTQFPITGMVQNWMDTGNACGMAFWTYGGDINQYTKFASREASGPVFECCFTTPPVGTVISPALDVPVRTQALELPISWSFSDAWGKTQSHANVQVRRHGSATPIASTQVTTEPTATVQPPDGGWTAGRYYVRVQVASTVPAGYETWGVWSAWQPFDVEPIGSAVTNIGAEGYRASDSAGGATVDLATGRLLLSRTDFAAAALGGNLGVGFAYDSARTTSSGSAAGWRVSMPTLGFKDQRAINPGFEEGLGSGCPTGWYAPDPAVATRGTIARNGASSLRLSRASVGNAAVYSSPDAAGDVVVVPGQRLDAHAWARTETLAAGSGGGVVLKISYWDEFGNVLSSSQSPELVEANTPSGTWRKIAVASVAPAGAYRARLMVAVLNSAGMAYIDDLYWADGTLELIDGDGTTREFNQIGGGLYNRDPLAGTLAIKRTNVARGVVPTLVGTGDVVGASTDGSYTITWTSGYDYVRDGSGASLTYDLGEAKVVSEARVHFWDGPDATPRTQTYQLQYANDINGPYSPLTAEVSGARSWQTHYFSPVKARYVRIANIDSSHDVMCIAEFELPVTTLSESPVCFDAAHRVTGIADTSGNLIRCAYDENTGLLTSTSDAKGRHADLVWSVDAITQIDFTGVGSAGDAVTETGVVRYVQGEDTFEVQRKGDDGLYATLATYCYTEGRITSVADADEVTSTVEYDGQGRVETITAAAGSTVTYDYASIENGVRITASGGGQSMVRDVRFDPAVGYQTTQVIQDPTGLNLTSLAEYDAYGHLKKTTDPQGRVDSFTSDSHGNLTATKSNAASSDSGLMLTTSATYTNDRLSKSTDTMGNDSYKAYDAKWRPASSSVAVTNDSAGQASVEEAYDQYGNPRFGELPSSTADDLLENGTFELDPNVAGNGWTLNWGVSWAATAVEDRADHGNGSLMSTVGYYGWSDQIPVTGGENHQLSLWSKGGGAVDVMEYDSSGGYLSHRRVMSWAPQQGSYTRFSTLYVPSATAGSVKIGLSSLGTSYFDNVRFEKANAAGTDNLIDNGSTERLVNGVPDNWLPVAGPGDAAQSAGEAGSRYIRLYGAPGSGYDSWWLSPVVPVVAGHDYTFSVSAGTQALVQNQQLAESGARVEVSYFADAAGTWPNEVSARLNLTGNLSNSSPFKRYRASTRIPAGVVAVRFRVRLSQCSGWMLADSFTVSSDDAAREEYTYDSTGTYRTKTESLSGAVVGAVYDSRGRVTQVAHAADDTSEATTETVRAYDAFDRLTSVVTAPASDLGIEAAYTYTPAGRLASVTDPLGRVTSLAYDEAGRLETVESTSGIKTSTGYDGLGRLSSVTGPYRAGQTPRNIVEYAYDALGRVEQSTYFSSADGSEAASSTIEYDDLSRPDIVTWNGDTEGAVDYDYDELGRVDSLSTVGPAGLATTDVTFNKASSPLTIVLTALGITSTTTNAFAKTGQWQTTENSVGWQWEFTFGTDGTLRRSVQRPDSQTLAPSAARSLVYNEATQLSELHLTTRASDYSWNSSPFADETIKYDSHGRVIEDTLDAANSALDDSHAYGYDEAGRLVSWALDGGTATVYGHDAAGNLTSIDAPGAHDRTFAYNDENWLVSSTLGSVTTTYTTDDFGRRTSETSPGGTVTYEWDSLGHLAEAASNEGTSTYEYGPTGMRERATVVSQEGTQTIESVWAGMQLALERHSDDTTYRYVYGPGGLPLELIVTPESGQSVSYAYQCDRAGSVIGLTDSAGALVAHYRYDPWGTVLEQGGALAAVNPLRYRGYYYDEATGLYYMPARFYDPATARFLSADPAGPSAGDPLTLNRYAYCVGDPVNASDPSGAIPDYDGNGRRDAYDAQYYMSEHAGTPEQRAVYKAKADVSYYSKHGTAQQVVAAQYDLYELVGWPGAPDAPAQTVGDGTPFGRDNYNLMPSRPDDTTWMLGGVGALLDVLTPLFGPAWIVPAVVGFAINGGYAVWYYQPLREQGKATWGDVVWTGVGAVPIIGIVPSVVTVVGYDFIPWAEPSN